MAQSLSSFATLVGPPIAGALASIGADGSADLNYLGIQLFSGIVMCFGAFQLIFLWYLLYKKEGQNWSILKGKGAVYSPDVINCCLGPIRSLRN